MSENYENETERISLEELEHPNQEYIDKHLPMASRLANVVPHSFTTLPQYADFHSAHRSFPCRSSDIWVASHPKAGTTWTQELVWCLVRGLDHSLSSKPLMNRFPFFEWDSLMTPELVQALESMPDDNVEKPGAQWRILEREDDPRLIKTHLHRELMPRGVRSSKSKIIYVVRDPRDVCVSLFHHTIKFLGYTGDFDHFVDMFLSARYEFGPYWSNVLSFWNRRKSDNILVLKYEDMHADLVGAVVRVAKYLEVPVPEDQLPEIVEHLSFRNMKDNPATNNESIMDGLVENTGVKFMRKGIVGDHKNVLSVDQLKMFQVWTQTCLKNSDFPYYRD
ncbi:luciferin sulfotransferase isoform X2 [Hyalella azteca]|uniref:Luciferin sulfotransferase isoform X2 n=1 Tax=Hyalella azteca TaxID=294128 RepID=A0A8B7P1P2_HYAAZ|nr:luciferin sulfotransferase isoform X2 [Hyalella azteca]